MDMNATANVNVHANTTFDGDVVDSVAASDTSHGADTPLHANVKCYGYVLKRM